VIVLFTNVIRSCDSEVFEEIKTWLKRHGGWNLRRDECWPIRDEDGRVERGDLRNPRDGERFVVLVQEIQEDLRAATEARIKKVIAATRWRRIKSRYKTETFHFEEPEDQEEPRDEPGFESVRESILRKHTRYKVRFKQRLRILARPAEDSPLTHLTFPDDGQEPRRESGVLHELVDHLARGSDQGTANLQGESGSESVGRGRERGELGLMCGPVTRDGRIISGWELGLHPELMHGPPSEEEAQGSRKARLP
jgi:hypothetical protein